MREARRKIEIAAARRKFQRISQYPPSKYASDFSRLSRGTVANHACVAAVGSNGSAVSVTPAEAIGVGVCGYAAIETPKRRQRASHHEISRFIMHRSIRRSSRKEKRPLRLGLFEAWNAIGWTSKFSRWKIDV